jgi:hypothetical protein
MIKRVNFTGRKRIPRDRVQIEVFDGTPRSFSATINLAEISLPAGASVVLEATSAGSSIIERFEFGEVGDIRPPADRKLRQLESEHVFFMLKVIDRTDRHGRLLGMADQIRPELAGKQTATGRKGILPIDTREMGQELWQLDLAGHDAVLFVNKDLPTLKDMARSDPFFYAVVYPQAVRQLLTQAILTGGDIDDLENDCWQNLWLRFGQNLHPAKEKPPSKDELETNEFSDDWIEDVVGEFCNMHQMKDKFGAAYAGREGEES